MYPLHIEKNVLLSKVDLIEIAKSFGTPTFVYSLDIISEKYDELLKKITWPKTRILYAMKSNSNKDILKFLAKKGASIDAVSIGEVLLAKKCGITPDKIMYTANNVSSEEMEQAFKEQVLINIGDAYTFERYAKNHPNSSVCIRVNPEVRAGEHKFVMTAGKLSKFGILEEHLPQIHELSKKHNIKIIGIHQHTGSGIYHTEDFYTSIKNTLRMAMQFSNLEFVDFGGGLKVPYSPDEKRIDYATFGKEIASIMEDFTKKYGRELEVYFEPGKFLVAESGVLLAQVTALKDNGGRLFAGVNSGFSQLIRPVLYQAYHEIINCSNPQGELKRYTIVGNICEDGDIFAEERFIPEISEKDILAIQNAGAYCYSMASEYNTRALPAEVVIENEVAKISKERETLEEFVERKSR